MSKKLTAKERALQQQRFAEDVVADVKQDFQNRQNFRRPYELAWQLNMNFVMGNQYCAISPRGAIEQEEKYYFWQEKQVYNHIAPIVETRLARLNRVRPKPVARPFSNSDKDIEVYDINKIADKKKPGPGMPPFPSMPGKKMKKEVHRV